jgi:drug/metabolite transporter (DMT)-like permease
MPTYLLYPLGSALLYSFAALILKRGMDDGIGPWRTAFVANLCMGLSFLPFLLFPGKSLTATSFLLPLLAGSTFFLGQVFTFLALNKGDVSIATPLLGTKILFVAILTTVFFHDTLPLSWWIAAVLATLAIAVMQAGPIEHRHRTLRTVIYCLISATAFAFTDLLVQRGGTTLGANRFIPVMFASMALLSFALIPFFRAPLFSLSLAQWKWLLPGAILLTGNAIGMAYAIASHGHATAINVVYTSRGIFTVALVWCVGHWFGNEERHVGPATMTRRLVGSTLIIIAIILVSLEKK